MDALETDIACRQCSYNLRGLAADALCPECATPVADSLGGDQLCHANAEWVRTVERGVTVYRLALGVMAVYSGWVTVARFASGTLVVDLWPVVIILEAAIVAGGWMLTAREPGRATERGGVTAGRWLVRIGPALVPCVHVAWYLGVETLVRAAAGRAGGIVMWWYLVSLAILAASVLSTFVVLRVFLRPMARRLPDMYIVHKLSTLAVAYLLFRGAGVAISFLIPLSWQVWPGTVSVGLYTTVQPMSILAGVLVTLAVVHLLGRLSRELRRAALGPGRR